MKSNKKRVVDTIKLLSLDMINKSNYQYIESSLINANVLYSIFAEGLIYNNEDPKWINRDRFVMATEKCLPAYYASLFLSSDEIDLNDLKKFNMFESNTPGYIDYKDGEGIAYAVGIALAEKYYASILNVKGKEILNYNTYVFCTEKELNTGVSYEALSLANKENLNKLVIICDCHDKEIKEIETLFDYYDFKMIKVNSNSITGVLDKTHDEKKPTIVIIEGSLPKEEKEIISKTTGKIKDGSLDKLRKSKNVCSVPFEILKDDLLYIRNKSKKHSIEEYELWQKDFEQYKKIASKEQLELIELLKNNNNELLFESDKFKINATYAEKLDKTNNSIINIIAKKYNNLLSCNTNPFENKSYISINETERNINLVNRDLILGSVLNGLASEKIIAIGNTKLVNSSKMINQITTSVKNNLPTIYVFTNDSIFDNDGFTYPISEMNSLRLIPGLTVFRPCDINEVLGCYEYALKYRKPVAIIIGSDAVVKYNNTNPKFVQYGAYMIRKETEKLDAVLISSGVEVKKAMIIAEELSKENIDIRVVSMPSIDLFENQKENYEKLLLPKNTPIIILEPSRNLIWNRFATDKNHIISVDNYISIGKKDQLEEKLNYSTESIKEQIKKLL